MKSEQCLDVFSELGARYGLDLETEGWDSTEIPGGVALADDIVTAFASAALQFGDHSATAYEMESSNKEFEPLSVSLDAAGFERLRRSLLSHFDLIMVPQSRKWVLVMSHELEGLACGPRHFLAALCVQG